MTKERLSLGFKLRNDCDIIVFSLQVIWKSIGLEVFGVRNNKMYTDKLTFSCSIKWLKRPSYEH